MVAGRVGGNVENDEVDGVQIHQLLAQIDAIADDVDVLVQLSGRAVESQEFHHSVVGVFQNIAQSRVELFRMRFWK